MHLNKQNKDYNKSDPEMKFWVQLKLLLWKNWLLRKRNKFRTITEVLWPLFMMLVLVLLHQVGEKHVLPNCHMKAKAMPSAGEVLFLQTFFCTINNTCDREANASMNVFNSSLVSSLGEGLQEAFNLTTSGPRSVNEAKFRAETDAEKEESGQNWVKDLFVIESLIEAVKKRQHEKLDPLAESFFKNRSVNYTCSSIQYSFFDELKQRKFLTTSEGNSSREKESNDVEILSRIKRKIYIAGVLKSFYRLLTANSKNEKVEVNYEMNKFNILDYLLCGPNIPSIFSQVNSLIDSGRKKSRESEETMDPRDSMYILEQLEWENDTTDFCNELMRSLESTYSSRVVFRLLKPLIRGKLLYTPDAPIINRVMARINETLSHVKEMIDLIKNASRFSPDIDELAFQDVINKYKNEELFLQEVVETKIGKMFLKNFGDEAGEEEAGKEEDKETIKQKINKFQKILDETLENWKSVLKESKNNSNFARFIPYLECVDEDRLIGFRDEETAVKEALKWLNQERLWGLVVFVNVPPDAEHLPPSLTYKIRTGIERTPDTNQIRDRVYVSRVKRNVIFDLRQITGGFAYLQNMVEEALIKEFTGRDSVPGIYLKQTPYPCHVYDSFRDVITRTFPMFMVISWIYIFCMVSKRIVIEKEILFKGTLRIFGVKTSQHWISWFVDAVIPMFLVTTIVSIMLVAGGLIPNSNIFVVWLFLSTFVLPTITLAFLVSTFFFRASFAMAVSGMIYFLLYLPYPPIQNFAELINPYFKVSACLISNVAFGLGCTWIANMEEIGIGAQLDKINYSPVPGNPITMGLILEMFFVDSLIYLLLAIYFDHVFAGNDFVKQPWYYFATRSYWRNSDNKGFGKPLETIKEEKDQKYFEPEPEGLRVGIEVINLTKEFGRSAKKRKAVNNLNINFYENQITSFLGHNGAGKTTTISMIIGLLPITEGTVRIYGVDIKNNPGVAMKNIGICRQENVLLDDLTVEEHFRLFARLKNRSPEEVENDVKELLGELQLGHRAKQPVRILSGGMKRKVCVAMAFIGGSRTVFLDEPTAGIDPYSRRSIWELLLKYKRGRTIILTTHFLDEADLLGDRIAIISSGELQCCGSGIFLKSQMGKGYYLTLESTIRSEKIGRKAKGLKTDPEKSPQVEELYKLIKDVIPGAEFSEEIGSEIVFILPSQIKAENYNTLFTELDKNKEKLNLSSYGVTDTSLEEVFMKILLEAEAKVEKPIEKNSDAKEILIDFDIQKPSGKQKNIKGAMAFRKVLNIDASRMIKQHFIALLIKRFLHHRRNFKVVLIEIFLPTLFMAIALALTKTFPAVAEMPPLFIDMAAYTPSSIFYSNDIPGNPHLSSYEEVLLGPQGLGTKCVLFPEECSLKSIPKGSLVAVKNVEDRKECRCSNGFFDCSKIPKLEKPPNAKMSSGDVLYNLTGLNLVNWLLTTELEYSEHRLAGISFGHFTPLSGIPVGKFLNLFMFNKFLKILETFIFDSSVLVDPTVFTSLFMSVSCNKTYGEELYKNKDVADNIIIWFNNRGWIADLSMMNGVTNLVLRASLPNGTDRSKYSIRLVNHPLPITKRQLEDQIELQTNIALLCALSVIWALSFIPAMYSVYLVEERISGLKHLQIVSGISRIVYWCTNLIWDLISYTISIFAIILLYLVFQMTAFIEKESIASFIILLYSYGFVNITFAYLISFVFSVPSSAFVFVACWNILSGVTTLLSTFTLTLISSKENPYYLDTLFMVFPQYCFGKSLINMALEGIRGQSLENFGVKPVKNCFAWHLTTKYIVFMVLIGVLFFTATFLVEYQVLQKFILKKMWMSKREEKWKAPEEEDEDVRKERKRVESGRAQKDGDVLIVNNLTKVYSAGDPPAVDHVCVGIKRGECFGLLGLNGAGKTTVFKMLTGYISPSEGDATIGGYSITKDHRQAKLLIGYCPQVNALDPYLTADEHLSFFCRIRGVTGAKKDKEIATNIDRLGLAEHRNKITKVLSGGNKRKVNTAIALVCNPELVLLDEPTSGMDVLSRRFLWNCLQDIVLEGRCVVLTSHSMEECQALCTHLSIMANGMFTCFGSSQHLKNKFNEGYSVTVKLYSPEKTEQVMKYFEENLPDSILVHVHYVQIKYKLSPHIFIGSVFTIMSRAKKEKLIQDYSISQATLESIFLTLAKTADRAKSPKSKYFWLKNFLCWFRKKRHEKAK